MFSFSHFSGVTEKPALSAGVRLYTASDSQQQVFIRQQNKNNVTAEESTLEHQAGAELDFLQPSTHFEDARYWYQVIPTNGCHLEFSQLVQRIDRGNSRQLLNSILALAQLIGQIHQHSYILSQLSPNALYWSDDGSKVQLLDYRYASRVSSVHTFQISPDLDLAALRTLAPEATGRVNSPMDQRADLYALGILCYALASGRYPFEQKNAIELVHAHIAIEPEPLLELNKKLNPMLAAIIESLLQKNPARRYHSIAGVLRDLEQCQLPAPLQPQPPFALALSVGIRQLPLSNTLYEREDQLAKLTTTFEEVSSLPQRGLIVVKGYSGVGKTAVIEQLQPLARRQGAFFIRGKFDQFLKHSLYSAVKFALTELAEQLLLLPDDELSQWQAALQKAVGQDGHLLLKLSPQWQSIIGAQMNVTELMPVESQSRFDQLLTHLLQVFASKKRSVILFLDDMHWADISTLKLLENLMATQGLHHFLLVLSYRENAVTAGHALSLTLDKLYNLATNVSLLSLGPLSVQAIIFMLAETLNRSEQDVVTLAKLLLQKTSGNPFYMRQFLLTLQHEGLLHCDHQGCWQWDLDAIARQDITDNHAELTASRFKKLPAEHQFLLKLAAVHGEAVPSALLGHICQLSYYQLEPLLAQSVELGILTAFTDAGSGHINYLRFSHDRLQHAAFNLDTKRDEAQLHADIAEYYLLHLSPDSLNDNVTTFIRHLNEALPLTIDQYGAVQLARYNVVAANQALETNDYYGARNYFEHARKLLGENGWQQDYALSYEIWRGLARSCYLSTDYTTAAELCTHIQAQLCQLSDKMQIAQLQVLILFAQNQLPEAFGLAADILLLVGIDISNSNGIAQRYLQLESLYDKNQIIKLAQRPALKQTELLLAMEILATLYTVAYIVGPEQYMGVTYEMMQISLRKGHSAASCLGYLGHAMNLTGAFGQYKAALDFADLALAVNQRYLGGYAGQLGFQRAAAILPWNAPLHQSLTELDNSLHQSLHEGNIEYAAHAALFSSFYKVLSGLPLLQANRQCEHYCQFIAERQFPYNLEFANIWYQFSLNLSTHSHQPLLLQGPAWHEHQLAKLQHDNNQTILFCYHTIKLMLAYLLEDNAVAQKHYQAAEPLAGVALSLYHQTEFYFFAALLSARLAKRDQLVAPEQSARWQAALDTYQEKFTVWSVQGHANHLHKLTLLQAEQAAISQQASAWQLYQQAIEQATAAGFIQHAAIAHELAGDYWQHMAQPDFALQHYQLSSAGFGQWQAQTKVQQLQRKHQRALGTVATPSTIRAVHSQQLDLASILKAAETLSGQVNLQVFLDTMMQIIVENAGAQAGCLLLQTDNDKLELKTALPTQNIEVPQKLIALVRRTGVPKLFNDLPNQPGLLTTADFTQTPPLSLLCMPVIVTGSLRGILYLAHFDMCGAFPQQRIEVLQLLANQTAILFENTRLYQQVIAINRSLEHKVEARTEQLAAAKIKAESATEAKSAFLARMSHEIRTPLNAVIGLSRLAAKRASDQEQQLYLSQIRESGEVLLSLVNDILDFSKIEAGKLTLERTAFSISEVVRRAFNQTSLRAHSKGLELVMDIASDIPKSLQGDPLRLQQVMVNLLSNAIKFTEDGVVSIHIEGKHTADERYQLHCAISDTGIGMSEEQQQHLFQSFSQADNSITRKYGGSGLGLTICKQLCELMQGEIGLQSAPGEGSTFWFTVKLDMAEDNQIPASLSENDGSSRKKTGAIKQLKALIVDDIALSRTVLQKQLANLGIQVEQTDNGYTAIDMVAAAEQSSQPFDFILMDWQMPQLDGIETSRSIQQRFGANAPHILMVSAYDKHTAQAKLNGVVISHFLEKPVNSSVLLDAVTPFLFEQPSAIVPHISSGSDVPDFGNKRLLLVEDHPVNRQVAVGFLQETHATIDIAENGLVALEKLQQAQYDLVLMDIQMPEMDGLTATRKIRQTLNLTLPIVAMTAQAMPTDIQQSLDAGMNDHLTKPIDPDHMYQVLRQYLTNVGQSVETQIKLTSIDELQPGVTDLVQLDTSLAQQRLGSQAHLYQGLQKIFYQEHRQLPLQLRHWLQHNDTEAMFRALHSLQSTAAYIGAMVMSKRCGYLAQILAKEQTPAADSITDIINALEIVLNDLAGQYAQTEDNTMHAVTPEQLADILQQLLPLLQQSDFAAEELLQQLETLAPVAGFQPQLVKLRNKINNIEYEAAAELVTAWLKQLT